MKSDEEKKTRESSMCPRLSICQMQYLRFSVVHLAEAALDVTCSKQTLLNTCRQKSIPNVL